MVHAAGNKGGVVCAAVDPELINSQACANADSALTVDPSRTWLLENAAGMGPGVTVDSSSGLKTLTLNGDGTGEGAVLDLSVEVRGRAGGGGNCWLFDSR